MIPEEKRKEIKAILALRNTNDLMIRVAHKYMDHIHPAILTPISWNTSSFDGMFHKILSKYSNEDLQELIKEMQHEMLAEQLS